MSQLTSRNIDILKIIINEYMETGNVLGSKLLLKKYNIGVSSATIRNDMAKLEALDLIYQPYNSAGRLPTTKGLRAFVNYLMEEMPDYFLNQSNSDNYSNDIKKLSDFIYNITYSLAKSTKEISFFIIPEKSINSYCGTANFLENNYDFLGKSIFNIIKVLEDKNNFSNFITSLPLNHDVNVFIGEENILNFLKDYTIIIKPVIIDGYKGYVGIIGSLKMDYNFNISAIKGII